MTAHLDIKSAQKFYKKYKAVDNVNLSIKQGEFVTILGPSGSGKTTLLKLIAGFEELNDGAIFLDGQDITKKKAYDRNIGMVFQNYALFPHMTVFDNIAYPLRLRNVSKADLKAHVSQALQTVRLEEFASRYPNQLSGGQQQRVALARAIVFNPPLLLLDEPLGALDKNLRHQMQYEIKHIQQSLGITTVNVTHDQEEALTMSDRICVMNKGRIEQIDTPERLYNHPKSKFVSSFIGEINLLQSELIHTEAGMAVVKLLDGQVAKVRVEQPEVAAQSAVWIAIRPENIHVVRDGAVFTNMHELTVLEKTYVGESFRIEGTSKTKERLTIKLPYASSREIAVGDEIRVGWNADEAALIGDETTLKPEDTDIRGAAKIS
ncbi:ABC transporter ATP-binding protein [Brevibacillus choshinensis]|uniref:ABC transporter ATP-binding protein n=1 Tax=Brevibacillus choshinensis TaxID=54911 RepID=UPI002E1E2050|nr:ABC transporter ATP-binding protein [Brevibacillus choshinensis]